MIAKTIQIVRRYPFSVLCVLLIWVLSLTPFFPETPLDDINFIDKYTHFVMYGGTVVVMWCEHLWHCRRQEAGGGEPLRLNRRTFLLTVVAGMVALGGLMELLQRYCTTTRSGEWLDFWADCFGVLLGNAVGMLLNKLWFKVK